MIRLNKSEAKELVKNRIEEEIGYSTNGEPSIGQLISSAVYAIDEDKTVSWCPICDREKEFCICEDEDAKIRNRKRQMEAHEMTEEEREKLQEKIVEEVKEQVGEEEFERLKNRDKEDMEYCPICWQNRFEELLYVTENEMGEDTVIGCKHCLGDVDAH